MPAQPTPNSSLLAPICYACLPGTGYILPTAIGWFTHVALVRYALLCFADTVFNAVPCIEDSVSNVP